MNPSLLFHNLTEEELDVFIKILKDYPDRFTMNQHQELMGKQARDLLIDLVSKQFIKRDGDYFRVLDTKEMVTLVLTQEYRYITNNLVSEDDNNYLVQIKNYLTSVQKQLAHVESESRKAFLNLRQMVDKISDQGKDHINFAFERAMDKNSETGEWVSIPHISPVGLYEPIVFLKATFKGIIEELSRSLGTMIKEYQQFTVNLLDKEDQDKNLEKRLLDKEEELLNETQGFNEEVLIALNEQVNTLEKNLGKDLMEQFDAIERLNELKPERVWIMLEETRSELNVFLNSLYSRILREINTLQINVDISKVSLILTNEAGKAIKKVDQIQRDSVKNLRPIKTLLDELEEE